MENTTEQTQQEVKTYTQEEVNDIVGKAKARTRAKIEKENNRKYGELIDTLKAGTGIEDVGEMTTSFKGFYESKGIKMPEKPDYSARDIETLAKADAEEIIRSGGYEEVVEETDRLSDIGVANMTAREKALFKVLAEHRQSTERRNELAQIGVPEDVYNSKDFQDFASMYKESTPITTIYENYNKTQPKKEFKTMGSMKNTTVDNGVKDYYSFEEASKFTKEDFDKNPALYNAVQKSMLKW